MIDPRRVWRAALGRDAAHGDDAVQREIDEELSFHLDMRTRENIDAGMEPEEARRRALERLGELDGVRRKGSAIRGGGGRAGFVARLAGDLRQDLRFALRGTARARGTTAIALITLMLGIGATTVIFSVADGVLLQPFPYAEPDRLVQFRSNALGPDTRAAWADGLSTLQGMSLFTIGSHEMVGPNGARTVSSLPVDAEFFRVLGVNAALGRTLTEEDQRPDAPLAVVITDRLWRTSLGADPEVVGRELAFDGRSATIVGILPPDFTFLVYANHDLFLPLSQSTRTPNMAIGRLGEGVSPAQGRAQAAALAASLDPGLGEEPSRFSYATLYEQVIFQEERDGILLLSGAVGLVLLIACANVANLLLARALARRDEIALRRALGAGRGRLVRQMLTESTLLSLGGCGLGLLLAIVSLPALLALMPQQFTRLDNIHVDIRVALFAAGISLATGLLFGLAPVAFAGRSDLTPAMSASGQRSGASPMRRRLLQALVVLEVALSLVLLIGAGLMLRAFLELRPTDPGFDARGKLMFELRLPERRYPDDPSRVRFHDRALRELRALPGVAGATTISSVPMVGMAWVIEAIPGGMDPVSDVLPDVWLERVAANYHELLAIPLNRGRALAAANSEGLPEMVVSEAAAGRLWPQDDAIGKTVTLRAPEATFVVVGVAADTRRFGLDLRARPTVWVRYADAPETRMTFITRARGGPAALADEVRTLVQRLDPELPLRDLQTLDTLLAGSVSLPRLYVTVLGAFGGIAVLLAAVGFYGVMSYVVGQRAHELGVRLAIGASPFGLLRLVLAQGMKTTALGVALGIAGSLALARVLESLLFGFGAVDPIIYALVVAMVTGIGLLACGMPARRAMRSDPLVTLRQT